MARGRDLATLAEMAPIAATQELEGLLVKYRELLAIRLADNVFHEGAATVQARMADLASRFPGSLRELDDMELDEIRLRTGALEAAVRDPARIQRWMEAVSLFHSLTRGALRAKRWLAGRKRVDAELERSYAAWIDGLESSDEARAWAGDLACIVTPPRGRVSGAVLARVGRRLGTTEREAALLVFGGLRRVLARS